MPVTWSPEAINDIARITTHIAAENPIAARRVAQELVLAADSLTLFPSRGRKSALPGRRPK